MREFSELYIDLATCTTVEDKLKCVEEIRARIDAINASDIANFLQILPSLINIIQTLPVSFSSDINHRIRSMTLEILNRLPNIEAVKGHAVDLSRMTVKVMEEDNEINALIALRMTYDLHKNYKSILQNEVEKFISFVQKMYSRLNEMVQDIFGIDEHVTMENAGPKIAKESISRKSIDSFLVLKECPLILTLIFQVHQAIFSQYAVTLIPVMVPSLNIVPPQKESKKQQNIDFLSCQIKTLSFITYLFKNFPDTMRSHTETLANAIVRFLKVTINSVTRKELLVACKHILNTEFKSVFFPLIDELLDENVIIGNGLEAFEMLRPLAYSTLADIVHHVRDRLDYDQLVRVVSIFSKNVHDPTLPIYIQITSIRLLLNLVESIYHVTCFEKLKGRDILVKIFATLVNKFFSLQIYIPKAIAAEESRRKKEESALRGDFIKEIGNTQKSPEPVFSFLKSSQDDQNMFSNDLSPSVMNSTPRSSESRIPPARIPPPLIAQSSLLPCAGGPTEITDEVKDCKICVRILIHGFRTIIWCLTNYNVDLNSDDKIPLNEFEISLIHSLFKQGMDYFCIFKNNLEDQKELIEQFGALFSILNSKNFRTVMTGNIDFLVNAILQDKIISTLPQSFLQKINSQSDTSISRTFADVLLEYLFTEMDKLVPVSNPPIAFEIKKSEMILKLFKVVFGSVKAYGTENEPALRPYLQKIIIKCLERGTILENSLPYFQLLRHLFKSISGGKFEHLYKAFLPLIPGTIERLFLYFNLTKSRKMKHVILELMLTIPARLSGLIPHLKIIKHAVLLSIEAYDSEIATLGLRTLEYWINHLPRSSIDTILNSEPFLSTLVESLNNYLVVKPAGSLGNIAIKILGKLGGKSKQFLYEPISTLKHRESITPGLCFQLNYKDSLNRDNDDCCLDSFKLPMDDLVLGSCNFLDRHFAFVPSRARIINSNPLVSSGLDDPALQQERIFQDNETADAIVFYKKEATQILKSSFAAMIKVPLQNDSILSVTTEKIVKNVEIDESEIDSSDLPNQLEISSLLCSSNELQSILYGLFVSASDADLQESTLSFVQNICRHFALVMVVNGVKFKSKGSENVSSENDCDSMNAEDNYSRKSNRMKSNVPLVVEAGVVLNSSKTSLDPLIMCEVIVKCFTDERHLVLQTAKIALTTLLDSLTMMVVSKDSEISLLSIVYSRLTERFCHYCYDPLTKNGALLGIECLLQLLPSWWIKKNDIQLFSAVIFVIKERHSEYLVSLEKLGQSVLNSIINILYPGEGSVADNECFSRLSTLLKFLGFELLASQQYPCECAKSLILSIYAQTKSIKIYEEVWSIFFSEMQDALALKSFFNEPINKVVIIMDIIVFFMASFPLLFSINEKIITIINEAVSISSENDPNAIPPIALKKLGYLGWKQQQHILKLKYINPGDMISLRTLIFQAFKVIIYKDLVNEQMRNTYISLLVKTLITCDENSLSDSAKDVIFAIVKNVVPSKNESIQTVFQECIKPLLSEVTDFTSLTTTLLSNIAVFVELLPLCFPENFGNILLGHLNQFINYKNIIELKLWESGEEINIVTGLLNLFHLIAQSPKLITDLVQLSVNFETCMHQYKNAGYINNPLLPPLSKFVNKYNKDAVQYFLNELGDPLITSLLVRLLKFSESKTFRLEFSLHATEIVKNSLNLKYPLINSIAGSEEYVSQMNDYDKISELHLQGLRIVEALTMHIPLWINAQKNVLQNILLLWNSKERQDRLLSDKRLDLILEIESKLIPQILLGYIRSKPEEVNFLFELLSAFLHRTAFDFICIREFIQNEVIPNYSVNNRKAILHFFVTTYFYDEMIIMDLKVLALQLIVIPLLAYIFTNEKGIASIPTDFVPTFIKNILCAEPVVPYSEAMNIQLLQLSTLLIQYLGDMLVDFRKELIKFSWSHLKRDDQSLCKMYAYLNVSRFIATFDTPAKIILQIYTHLLRQNASLGRKLVQQSLDILAPALPVRLPKVSFINAIYGTKKIINDECHGLPQLVHLMQLIVRHPLLYYNFRSQFVPHMAQSLLKLGLPPNNPPLYRNLSIDLCDLIVEWEHRRRSQESEKGMNLEPNIKKKLKRFKRNTKLSSKEQFTRMAALYRNSSLINPSLSDKRGTKRKNPFSDENSSKKVKVEISLNATKAMTVNVTNNFSQAPQATEISLSNQDEYKPNNQIIEMMINFLIKITLSTSSNKSESTSSRSIKLLSQIIKMWPQLPVRFSHFEKLFPELIKFKESTKIWDERKTDSNEEIVNKKKVEDQLKYQCGICCTCFKILSSIISSSATHFLIKYLKEIQQLFEMCFDLQYSNIQDCANELLSSIITRYPYNHNSIMDVSIFYSSIINLIQEKLKIVFDYTKSNDFTKGKIKENAENKIDFVSSTLTIFETLMKNSPNIISKFTKVLESIFKQLVNVFVKLSKKDNLEIVDKNSFVLDKILIISKTIFARLQYFDEGARFSCISSLGDLILASTNKILFEYLLSFISASIAEKENDFHLLSGSREGNFILFSYKLSAEEVISLLYSMSNASLGLNDKVADKNKLLSQYFKLISKVYSINSYYRRFSYLPCWEKLKNLLIIAVFNTHGSERKEYISSLFSDVGSNSSVFNVLQMFFSSDLEFISRFNWLPLCFQLLMLSFELDDSRKVEPLPETSQLEFLESSSTNYPRGNDNSFFNQEKLFLKSLKYLNMSSMMNSISEMAYADREFSGSLWLSLFPSAWDILSTSERNILASSLLSFLSSPHMKSYITLPSVTELVTTTGTAQYRLYDNVISSPLSVINIKTVSFFTSPSHILRLNPVKVLLESFSKCRKDVSLPPELLFYLSGNFGGYHSCISLLERRLLNDTGKSLFPFLGNVDKVDEYKKEQILAILCKLYSSIQEDNYRNGCQRLFATMKDTQRALALQNQNLLKEAQNIYLNALTKISDQTIDLNTLPAWELNVWEEEWVNCSKELSQWDSLHDYSFTTSNTSLLLESSCKVGDWSVVKALLKLDKGKEKNIDYRISEIYLAIQEGNVQEVEILCANLINTLLKEWQHLPSIISHAHKNALVNFQRIVELQESALIMEKISSGTNSFDDIYSVWRERLPHRKIDSVKVWDDVLSWRLNMFSFISQTFSSNKQIKDIFNLQDASFTLNKLANIARKNGFRDSCIYQLNRYCGFEITSVMEQFEKAREQALVNFKQPDHISGLNTLNSLDLSGLNPDQKTEIFRLKGNFLAHLGKHIDSSAAFSHALLYKVDSSATWLSWGEFLDNMFIEKKDINFAAQSMCCYMEAIVHQKSSDKEKSISFNLLMNRILWMVSNDDSKGTMLVTFKKYFETVPIWTWIPWIPQLLTSLTRSEAHQIRSVLLHISKAYPQALYYTLRAFLLEKREIPSEKENSDQLPTSISVPSMASSASSSAISFVDTILPATTLSTNEKPLYVRTAEGKILQLSVGTSLHQLQVHPKTSSNFAGAVHVVTSTTTATVDTQPLHRAVTPTLIGGESNSNTSPQILSASPMVAIPVRSSLSYSEEIMLHIRKCNPIMVTEIEGVLEAFIFNFKTTPLEDLLIAMQALLSKCLQLTQKGSTELVPNSLNATLERVKSRFFSPASSNLTASDNELLKFKMAFERDFNILPNTYFDTIINSLQKWKSALEIRLHLTSNTRSIESYSRNLAEFRSTNIEIPGQYNDCYSEQSLSNIPILERFDGDVVVIQTGQGSSLQKNRISMYGSDGKKYSFMIQNANPTLTRTDERVSQMHAMFNKMFEISKNSHHIQFKLHVPVVIPITPRIRFVNDLKEFKSLGDIYSEDCVRKGIDPNFPVLKFRNTAMAQHVQGSTNEETRRVSELRREARQQSFENICKTLVSESILSEYMLQTFRDPNSLWIFRREFTIQWAMTSLISYVMFIGDRTPNKININLSSGEIKNNDFRPMFNNMTGMLEVNEHVPFRFTRNINHFVTPIGRDGLFANSMVTFAKSLLDNDKILRNYLRLFLRDDLLAWFVRNNYESKESEDSKLELKLREKVHNNVSRIFERIVCFAPYVGNHGVLTQPVALNDSVCNLIEQARDDRFLSNMTSTWIPFY